MRKSASLLLVVLLAACASATTDYYTLTAVPPAQPGLPAARLRPPIEVGEVSIPATIDRDEVVLAAPGDRLDVASDQRVGRAAAPAHPPRAVRRPRRSGCRRVRCCRRATPARAADCAS